MTKEELIKIIAEKHNILLGKDDPIIILVTAIDFLTKKYDENLREVLSENIAQLELNLSQYDKSVKINAEKIINAALSSSKKMLTTHIQESAIEVKKLIKDEILAAKIDFEIERKKINFHSKINSILLIFIMVIILLMYL